jgi:parvulin-like peptidyl-prolyl isomerase
LGETGANPTASSAATDDVIFGLKEGEITKTPVKVGDNWVVIGVTKRTDADLAEFAKQRDSLVATALRSRQGQVFEDYISSVQARMTREGKIKINEDVLARLQDEAPAALPQRPRMPPGFPPPTQ